MGHNLQHFLTNKQLNKIKKGVSNKKATIILKNLREIGQVKQVLHMT